LRLVDNHNEENHLAILDNLLDKSSELIICVAFLKMSGLISLEKKLKAKVGRCTFFIGTDFYLTEPNALRLLYKQGHLVFVTKQVGITFHPKIFYFKTENSISLLSGSANITNGGLNSNFEASLLIETTQNSKIDCDFKKLITTFENNSRKVNERFIEAYEINYTKYRNRHKQADLKFEAEKTNEEFEDEKEEYEVKTEGEPNERNRGLTRFTENDREKFPFLLEQYKQYKIDVRPSGVVSKRDSKTHPELLAWYRKIIEIDNNDILPPDIKEILTKVGFPFEGGQVANSRIDWNKNYQKLIQYKINNNLDIYKDEFRVPQRKDVKHPDHFLGGWCARQKLRRNNKITPKWDWDYEETKMKEIRFIWDVPSLGGSEFDDDEWFENLKLLENYYKHNPTTIKKSIPKQETQVGGWLNDQMTLRNTGRKNKKTGEVIKLHPLREGYLGIILEENGIEWKWEQQKHRIDFEEKLAELLAFQKGDKTKIPPQGKEDVTGVGQWFAQIRTALKPNTSKKVPQWKIDRLKEEGVI
jgi:HKD family nuclease